VTGREATFVVRPESIRLAAPEEAKSTNAIAGRIEIVSFQGPTSHIEVLTEGGRQLLVELPGEAAQDFSLGQNVTAVWDPSSVVVCDG
jgi:ABC-type Fe3+/spermidine/putrescine transport system ATPase subunit